MNTHSLGFIGTGRIATAVIAGLASNGRYAISGFDKNPAASKAVEDAFGISCAASPGEIVQSSDIIILAVKPYQIEEVLGELRDVLTADHLLISVAAGISSDFIRKCSGQDLRVIRAMPNTPAFVGEGMTAISRGRFATDGDIEKATDIFSSIGKSVVLDESLMDAATALSGSGPAYMFGILASFVEGGKQCGLSEKDALILGAQTMLGAAKMVLESKKSPEELIREVTTPGGTTEAGLKQMKAHNVHQALIDTVKAAAQRSLELKK